LYADTGLLSLKNFIANFKIPPPAISTLPPVAKSSGSGLFVNGIIFAVGAGGGAGGLTLTANRSALFVIVNNS
jgi:hypothetical protein